MIYQCISAICLCLLTMVQAFAVDTSFIAIEANSGYIVKSIGPSVDCRASPCCTFNIALSLMGYQEGVLLDRENPVWTNSESDAPITPRSWIGQSAVWYSKQLLRTLGQQKLRQYLSLFSYGNQDVSGGVHKIGDPNGFTSAHICSSLEISPREQVQFLQRLFLNQFPLSEHTVEATKELLYQQTLPSGWRLYVKTGTGLYDTSRSNLAWYVGWIEKDRRTGQTCFVGQQPQGNGQERYLFALLLTRFDQVPTKEQRWETVRAFFHEAKIDI